MDRAVLKYKWLSMSPAADNTVSLLFMQDELLSWAAVSAGLPGHNGPAVLIQGALSSQLLLDYCFLTTPPPCPCSWRYVVGYFLFPHSSNKQVQKGSAVATVVPSCFDT
ncbi:hypothetical protein CEUSTIGMA_g12035.t1 [Chlamydomonas eustigma]|uniref:Uncharacterized protein n=1 Tax=Chlamydomonas eustigma TaxID=1157962 RepID=A0A250XNE8_9CHLO|nr:hypothetical protein CEUSTIGMA_g12035.t1 [Chlamydomonas eustigma]|eukprot:GAX84614.1 hypothetical protein CEUSTIGMA_g12035.t1 [Chlamydomonas eustigma]